MSWLAIGLVRFSHLSSGNQAGNVHGERSYTIYRYLRRTFFMYMWLPVRPYMVNASFRTSANERASATRRDIHSSFVVIHYDDDNSASVVAMSLCVAVCGLDLSVFRCFWCWFDVHVTMRRVAASTDELRAIDVCNLLALIECGKHLRCHVYAAIVYAVCSKKVTPK